MRENNRKFSLAILSVIILILGMYLGFKFNEEIKGVGFRSKASSIEQIMRLIEKKYVVEHDLLAVARALCQKNKGIAVI